MAGRDRTVPLRACAPHGCGPHGLADLLAAGVDAQTVRDLSQSRQMLAGLFRGAVHGGRTGPELRRAAVEQAQSSMGLLERAWSVSGRTSAAR